MRCLYRNKSLFSLIVTFCLCALSTGLVQSDTLPLYPTLITPGSADELTYLSKDIGTDVVKGARHAELNSFCSYSFPCLPGARCRLWITLEDDKLPSRPNISVSQPDLKPLPYLSQTEPNGVIMITWTVPFKWVLGDKINVTIGAKTAPYSIKLIRFQQQEGDATGNGIGDSVEQLLRFGYPANTSITVNRPPQIPYTITQTPRPPSPDLDIQTDALFAYTTSFETIQAWKERKVTVWTMGGSRDGKVYATQNPGEVQTDKIGSPITIEGSFYLSPTRNRLTIEGKYYRDALIAGSEGVCPEEPEYWLRGGYESVFKEAWQKEYNTPWEPPHQSLDARWRTGRLMAKLQTNHIDTILREAKGQKPSLRGLVALHSPINYAQWGIVSPQFAITSLSNVQEVIGQVWTGTSRSPVRYAGLRKDHNFALAYLEYSSLYHLMRETGKRLWFLMDPLEDNLNLSHEDYKNHYEETLVASLLFPAVNSYEVMPWPERVFGRIPAPYATEIQSVMAALQEMHNQTEAKGNVIDNDTIGVFVSDSMQWQRAEPAKSDFDGLWGLTLPLIQHGVPVQIPSLDRATTADYLKPFKTLLLSYDYQKPLSAEVHTTLANWVRGGGSLLFFGGADPYNAVQDGWWTQKGHKAAQDDLWGQLGIPAGASKTSLTGQTEAQYHFVELERGNGAEHELKNRRRYSYDISSYVKETGSVAFRFNDVTPQDGWGGLVSSFEIKVGGKSALQFRAGTELESRFLIFDHNSHFNGQGRFADGASSWVYQIDGLPRDKQITVHVEMGNGFLFAVSPAKPDASRVLQASKVAGDLGRQFPRFRIPPAYPVTYYPAFPPRTSLEVSKKSVEEAERLPTGFYAFKDEGIPIWKQSVGKGTVVYVGIAPGYFSNSGRSGSLLRNIVEYAQQRSGAAYNEANALRLRRGKYLVVRSLGDPEPIEGRMVDLLSPTLAVTNDRTLPANSVGLYADLPSGSIPRIAHIAGRIQASVERPDGTAFFVRGVKDTFGVARLWSGNRSLSGARGSDRLGNSISVETFVDGSTVLLRYPNHPDGVVIRVGWSGTL